MTQHVYLIHFDKKYRHAEHYIGYSKDLGFRIECHREGSGAKLLRAVNKAGIPWNVVRTWRVDGQGFERQLKNQKHSARFCPVCNPDLVGIENDYQEPKGGSV